MPVRVRTARTLFVAAIIVSAFVPSAAAQSRTSFKLAYYNIQGGKGEPAMAGHEVEFYDVANCTDTSQPVNAWGVGFIQAHLMKSVGSDPDIVAIGLGEGWACGNPENVRKALGWKARSSERNGVGIVARHGFGGPEEWVQLDTTLNPNPVDTMWVLRVPVCLNATCSKTMNVFTAHWYSTGANMATVYDRQAVQTVEFLKRAGGVNPHVLIGDLNVWEGVTSCGQSPAPYGLRRLRDAHYIDAWPTLHGDADGTTGMTNRNCGSPLGSTFKRIDYAWSPAGMNPLSIERFGIEPVGDGQPSDHYGIIAEYAYPAGDEDNVDTQAPSVVLASPSSGTTVTGATTITAQATDDRGVTRVEILEDDVVAHTVTSAPWQVSCDLSNKTEGSHTLRARAYDAAGNVGVSSIVQFQVAKKTESLELSADEIVLYAKDASAAVGNWKIVSDATAAGGARMWNPDAGLAKVAAPAANPASYFELTFNAQVGRPYRLWIRGRADRDYWGNDSVFVQFSGSVNESGAAIFRSGTTAGTWINLEDASSAGISGWGWQDNGYGAGVLGQAVYFATAGPHTIRIQTREDGLSIDQIVLSSMQFLTVAPGSLKQDTTILPQAVTEPILEPSRDEVVLLGADASRFAGAWLRVADTSAAGGYAVTHPDAGGAKLGAALANPVNYVEFTFEAEAGQPYRLWIRSRADRDYWGNDSVFVQFSNAVDANGAAVLRIGTRDAATVNLEDAANAGISGWGWQDNGYGTGLLGPTITFNTTGPQTIRIQTREDGLRIDQITLSSEKYLTSAPGALKQDTTKLR